jgi:hypothetical protein
MVDRDLLIAKAASVRTHLDRIADKTKDGAQAFLGDLDDLTAFLSAVFKKFGIAP